MMEHTMASVEDLKVTILVTIGYLASYYLTIIPIVVAKMKAFPTALAKTRQNHPDKNVTQRDVEWDRALRSDPLMVAAERTQLNMLEQMPPFLVCFWLYSVFIDPSHGASLAILYTVLRYMYFFLWPKYHYLITLPNYFIIAYYCVGLVRLAAT